LDAFDIVKFHLVSQRLRSITRDAEFWKRLCYDDSNSAANQKTRDLQFIAPSIFQQPATVFELQRRASALSANSELGSGEHGASKSESSKSRSSQSKRAAANWDPSYTNEKVDWYEEYIARHAPISMSWLQLPHDGQKSNTREIKGLGIYERSNGPLVVAPLDDGGVAIWNVGRQDGRRDNNSGAIVARSRAKLLSGYKNRDSSTRLASGFRAVTASAGDGQCVSVDRTRNKVYIASHDNLDEVDLETLQITTHERYPWAISALSEASYPLPLTVATTHSLHLHDPRLPNNAHPMGYEQDGQVEGNTAALPPPSQRPSHSSHRDTCVRHSPLFNTGPQSITHLPSSNGQHDTSNGHICVAGRFPSILTYNRRMFPQLSSTIHSGSRLASMTSLPHPLLYSRSHPPLNPNAAHTLIACGEYNGKGSLEIYPFSTSGEPNLPTPSSSSSSLSSSSTITQTTNPLAPIIPYKNRTSASSSKLLSITPHGTRIVFSDGDGGLKWVERDGHSLVRRWNINAYTASTSSILFHSHRNTGGLFANNNGNGNGSNDYNTNDGANVARKIVPVGGWDDGKGELAMWTGEQVGVLGFRPKPRFVWEQLLDDGDGDDGEGEMENREYARRMRKALQRQADEVRFVRGLGLGR
ncbi:MAG: hypothetical protein Q9224_006159, partial [Gallowayella concinna]